ncbi:uncharacterized protein PRCAT00006306001 [Priceomyces carsonii]|uniref:uncharacterized protein n=1 Tax=Priceomyces carsonii TaxID=28549 RepID=UPI002ED9406F|nr:unnamed protein product [Priceomyces carsonii]
MAYWFVPRIASDKNFFKVYLVPGSRAVVCRSHSTTETQAYFALNDDSEELEKMPKASMEKQKEFWSQRFQGAGWQKDRFIEGMKSTDNFYCQEVIQIHTGTWYKGRVVLLGDAAKCPSSASGMGTSSALISAYVLAGEIVGNSKNLTQAFANYDKTIRPFINRIQKLNGASMRLPKTKLGVSLILFLARLLCFFRIPYLITKFSKEEKGGWQLPSYGSIKLNE